MPVLDLDTAVGIDDEITYQVDKNWSDRGILSTEMLTDSTNIYPDQLASGEWKGDIQDLGVDRTGTFTGVGDARDGSGEYLIKLYSQPPSSITAISNVTINTTTSYNDYNGLSSNSFNHYSNGSNRLLIVSVASAGSNSGDIPSSITYAGDELTELNTVQNGRHTLSIFYEVNPPQGNHTVQANFGETNQKSFRAVTYDGVDQDSPFIDTNSNTQLDGGDASSWSTSVQADDERDLVIDRVATERPIVSVGSGQNITFDEGIDGSGSDKRSAGSIKRGENQVTMSWTQTEQKDYAHQVVSIDNYRETAGENPDEVIGIPVETGRVTEDINLSGYKFFEVDVELSEVANTDNKRPRVDSIRLDLTVSEDSQVGIANGTKRNIIYLIWAFGILMFIFGIYKAIKLRSEGLS